ncbi:Beta-xylosidase [[Actinomadura] parvosata subsp. kistnae]|uniref:Glycoside hydrolase 43 family protein n=1 Tax=[Actinomadura] parvosata subsp. kistnae TaxID=1909395 RepID=A0A1V0A195_9ACTN|nr:glycoside hydrolase family 43 protein [Nonomuraea sp. ATCC 55076]AQZ63968.1 glycoside hydrolase 43 family protein [Nonomuraea sp. ATCC 55076]SPL89834.1 Beta-xylosidase [Actinomadura parvosata subsp. kistnae]
MRTFRNPVLPGCHPDPSICRVGADFYLVTSSFAYYPGLPLFHSRDLVRWRRLTHVLNRPGQLPLQGLDVSDGVWAPTIRHHDGTFYVVSTVAVNRQGSITFVVTATDPAGPWSDPVPLEAEGIDPSLFFDDDGRCWFTACRDAAPGGRGPGELWMRELDLERLKLVGPTHVLWHGAVRGAWVEAPRLYKRDGVYHLLAAEGGTERNHSVTAARAATVTGPYVTDPRSPLLTHRHRGPAEPVHNVGHADLVDTPDGETWAVTLAVRPIDGTHTLGREVFLVPVTWTEHGPVFAPETGGVRLTERLPRLAAPFVEEAARGRTNFDGAVPGLEWSSLRGPVTHLIRPAADGRGLEIDAAPEPLTTTGVPAFIARRQQHVRCHATTSLTFPAAHPAEEAGLAVFQNQAHHATLALTVDEEGHPQVALTIREVGTTTRLATTPLPPGKTHLSVESDESRYLFRARPAGTADWTEVGTVERSFFSTERAGGFVGVHLGLYATANGRPSTARATVRRFDYEPGLGE